jgi:hypothetical protein
MNARHQVLIPSDDFDFVANFPDAYRKVDFGVSAGRINLRFRSGPEQERARARLWSIDERECPSPVLRDNSANAEVHCRDQ